MLNVTVFFGAGKLGKKILEFWRFCGVEPDFFADNDKERWGTLYDGVKILSIEELLNETHRAIVLITCAKTESIYAQLTACEVPAENIYLGNKIDEVITVLISHRKVRYTWSNAQKQCVPKESVGFGVLFDVQYGFVLGGVESWALEMAKMLSLKRNNVKCITTDLRGCNIHPDEVQEIQLKYQDKPYHVEMITMCINEIRNNLPCNIICNFPSITFQASCIAKMLWPDEINIIAIVHCDEEVYYEQYGRMEALIDCCLVISDTMEEQLIKRGMKKDKIRRMGWNISCEKQLKRTYSKKGEPIRIGYAGRLVKHQKRLDILMEVANRLTQLQVDFRLEIAGTGEYEETLRKAVEEFEGQICLKGCIAREHIGDFWRKQDIAISCSDYEGRSISKAEAMAAGAVPVITDTSGAREDVQDGYHGYIVPVGDIDSMTDRICHLYQNRDLLKVMGERSHQVILEQNTQNDMGVMWDYILKK
ncbi:MAG: glycosyltransferase family 4 protein [Lachnospiraceae bacterium]|nr:glycosyltransferase family 4 protein [Lachnospiraceae bacterium]